VGHTFWSYRVNNPAQEQKYSLFVEISVVNLLVVAWNWIRLRISVSEGSRVWG
jgi:hypothetical protein